MKDKKLINLKATMKVAFACGAIGWMFWSTGNVCNAQTPPSKSFQVPAATAWFDTGIKLSVGEVITITASGSVYVGNIGHGLNWQTPAGSPIGSVEFTPWPQYLARTLPWWSLIGKIGKTGTPFEVGTSTTISASWDGELYLSVNDNWFLNNAGSWSVTVRLSQSSPLPWPPLN